MGKTIELFPSHSSMEACAPWLRDLIALAKPRRLGSAVAIGMLGRLWVPTDEAARRAVLEGTAQVTIEANRLARAFAPRTVRSVELAASRAAGAWMADFDANAGVPEHASGLLHRRDDLECVLWTLRRCGAGERLAARLAAFDEEVKRDLGCIAVPENFDDEERFREVALSEPDAWWASFDW